MENLTNYKGGEIIKFRTPDLMFMGISSIIKKAEFIKYIGNDPKDRVVVVKILGEDSLIHEKQIKT